MADSYPTRWTGRLAIVTFPRHADELNASQIREELLLVINRGARELIVDMTGTVSCEYAGAAAVARAHRRAAAAGAQLRLAVTAEDVCRVLTVNGLDRFIRIYPPVEAAITDAAPTATVRGGTPQPASQSVPQPRDPARSAAVRPH